MRFPDEPYGSKQCMGPVAAVLPVITAAAGAYSAIKTATAKSPKAQSFAAPAPAVEAPKPITKPYAQSRPDSLATLSGYAPDQERTFLATKGTQGGLGKEEDSYYKNLIQRSLIGDDNRASSGSVDDYLKPVESQYFAKGGANTGGIEDFLRSIRGY